MSSHELALRLLLERDVPHVVVAGHGHLHAMRSIAHASDGREVLVLYVEETPAPDAFTLTSEVI
jgi:hypothetical protein